MVFLSFEKSLDIDMTTPDFGKAKYAMTFKKRPNLSRVRLDSTSGCRFVEVGQWTLLQHEEKLGMRYAACTNITYDSVLSIYDVNRQLIMVYRFYTFDYRIGAAMVKRLGNIKDLNVEARLIGMQNGQGSSKLDSIYEFLRQNKVPIMEVDLFGGESRNVAFDVKTGISFNVLAENRPYKPSELNNPMTMEQFERTLTPEVVVIPEAAPPKKKALGFLKPKPKAKKAPQSPAPHAVAPPKPMAAPAAPVAQPAQTPNLSASFGSAPVAVQQAAAPASKLLQQKPPEKTKKPLFPFHFKKKTKQGEPKTDDSAATPQGGGEQKG